jgi:hypothetical protein
MSDFQDCQMVPDHPHDEAYHLANRPRPERQVDIDEAIQIALSEAHSLRVREFNEVANGKRACAIEQVVAALEKFRRKEQQKAK